MLRLLEESHARGLRFKGKFRVKGLGVSGFRVDPGRQGPRNQCQRSLGHLSANYGEDDAVGQVRFDAKFYTQLAERKGGVEHAHGQFRYRGVLPERQPSLSLLGRGLALCVGSDTGSGDGSSGSHKYHRVGGGLGKAQVWPMQSLPKCWLVPGRPKGFGPVALQNP